MNSAELLALLKSLYLEQDEALRSRFQRSLPFQDGAFDRWERAQRLGFGDGASIYNSALVFGDVKVGAQTWIGPYVVLEGLGAPLTIGAFCSISSGVHIYTHDTVLWALSKGLLPKRTGAVTIGDSVYIGSQTVIATGVTIGARSVVAANSFVNRDVASGTIIGGSPARTLGRVIGQGADVRLDFDDAS